MENKIAALNKKAKITVIPNGLNAIPSMAGTHKNYLLFLGRLDYREKGLDTLLEAMKILKKELPELELIIAGDGKDRESVEEIIKNDDLTNIKYVGKVSGKEKEKLLAECFAMVQPSRMETFSLSTLEGAAYGKPSITYQIENLEYIDEYKFGFRVQPFDHKAFANKIRELYKNQTLYETFSQNAHNWAKKHLWDDIAKEQEKFYKEVLKK
jgi:rhamnosyl/mannosyltransferase